MCENEQRRLKPNEKTTLTSPSIRERFADERDSFGGSKASPASCVSPADLVDLFTSSHEALPTRVMRTRAQARLEAEEGAVPEYDAELHAGPSSRPARLHSRLKGQRAEISLPREVILSVFEELRGESDAVSVLAAKRMSMVCKSWRAMLLTRLYREVVLNDLQSPDQCRRFLLAFPGLLQTIESLHFRARKPAQRGGRDVSIAGNATLRKNVFLALRGLVGRSWRGVLGLQEETREGCEHAFNLLTTLADLPSIFNFHVAPATFILNGDLDRAFCGRSMSCLQLWGLNLGNGDNGDSCFLDVLTSMPHLSMLHLSNIHCTANFTRAKLMFRRLEGLSISIVGRAVQPYEDLRWVDSLLSRCSDTLAWLRLGGCVSTSATAPDLHALSKLSRLKSLVLSGDWLEEALMISTRGASAKGLMLRTKGTSGGSRFSTALATATKVLKSYESCWPMLEGVYVKPKYPEKVAAWEQMATAEDSIWTERGIVATHRFQIGAFDLLDWKVDKLQKYISDEEMV